MDILVTLGRTLGFSMAAGVNLYATVGILGLASRYGWVALPEQFKVFDHDAVIYSALALFVIEFVADKIPWLDTLWDGVHTAIRPLGGALLALAIVDAQDPAWQAVAFLLGGGAALISHGGKASARVVVNASPEPVSNVVVSTGEDVGTASMLAMALANPVLAVVVAIVALAFAVLLIVAARRILRKLFPPPGKAGPRP